MTLSLRDVQYQWPGRSGFSLSVPELDVAKGETVLLLGESGSGKSTLLSLICGTILPNHGTISIDGININRMSGGKRDQLRAEAIGVIFQQFNLLPFGTVRDNILLPLHFAPKRRERVRTLKAEVEKLCAALDLPKGIEKTKANTLSVGQQQRVAVARALIGHPPLVLADEPTSALDAATQTSFLKLLFDQTASHDTSVVMVSHDPRLGDHFDRVIQMKDIASFERGLI